MEEAIQDSTMNRKFGFARELKANLKGLSPDSKVVFADTQVQLVE